MTLGFPHSGSRREHSTASAEGDAPAQRVSIKKDDETWYDLRSYEVEDEHAEGERNRKQELEDEVSLCLCLATYTCEFLCTWKCDHITISELSQNCHKIMLD